MLQSVTIIAVVLWFRYLPDLQLASQSPADKVSGLSAIYVDLSEKFQYGTRWVDEAVVGLGWWCVGGAESRCDYHDNDVGDDDCSAFERSFNGSI